VGKYSKDAGIRVTEFCSFKEISLWLHTEVLVGIKLKLKGANQLSNITALHLDIAIGSIVAIYRRYLVLPQPCKVVKVHFRNVDEAETRRNDSLVSCSSEETHVPISSILKRYRPSIKVVVKIEPVNSVAL
jgi:hypothetical protein